MRIEELAEKGFEGLLPKYAKGQEWYLTDDSAAIERYELLKLLGICPCSKILAVKRNVNNGIMWNLLTAYVQPKVNFVRETMQNATDAKAHSIEYTINLDRKKGMPFVKVKDDGEGMSLQDVIAMARSIGASSKGPELIGEKGIGYNSAFKIGETVVVVSNKKSDGTANVLITSFKVPEIRKRDDGAWVNWARKNDFVYIFQARKIFDYGTLFAVFNLNEKNIIKNSNELEEIVRDVFGPWFQENQNSVEICIHSGKGIDSKTVKDFKPKIYGIQLFKNKGSLGGKPYEIEFRAHSALKSDERNTIYWFIGSSLIKITKKNLHALPERLRIPPYNTGILTGIIKYGDIDTSLDRECIVEGERSEPIINLLENIAPVIQEKLDEWQRKKDESGLESQIKEILNSVKRTAHYILGDSFKGSFKEDANKDENGVFLVQAQRKKKSGDHKSQTENKEHKGVQASECGRSGLKIAFFSFPDENADWSFKHLLEKGVLTIYCNASQANYKKMEKIGKLPEYIILGIGLQMAEVMKEHSGFSDFGTLHKFFCENVIDLSIKNDGK